MGIGDWGLGLGNPQSPIPNPHFILSYKLFFILKLKNSNYIKYNNIQFKYYFKL